MNKRFTMKFIKYISVFVIISLLIVISGFIIFFISFSSFMYNSIEEVDSGYLIENIRSTDDGYELTNHFERILEESNTSFFLVDDEANTIMDDNGQNIKSLLLKHLHSTVTIPYKKNEHVVLMDEGEENSTDILNMEEIDPKLLIDSLYAHNYNQHDFHITDGHLEFVESLTTTDYSYADEFTAMDISLFKIIGVLFIVIPLTIITLTIIMSLLLARRVSRPLFFYVDWLEQLAKGQLYKPNKKHKREKSQLLYKELDQSVETLNSQLLDDRMYRNQIDYYRDKWLNQISHDLKSPLTSIYGYSRVLPLFPNDNSQYATLISEKAKYMEELIDNLNQSFRLETNQMESDKEMFSVPIIIKEIIKIVGYPHIEINIALDYDLYYGNRLYFERMMINLIENSLDHNNDNPNIRIFITDNQNNLIIDYEDDGVGVGNKTIEDLKEKSYSTKQNSVSHGFGFSVILDAVDFHQGNMEMLPVEKGVHFQIKLG